MTRVSLFKLCVASALQIEDNVKLSNALSDTSQITIKLSDKKLNDFTN